MLNAQMVFLVNRVSMNYICLSRRVYEGSEALMPLVDGCAISSRCSKNQTLTLQDALHDLTTELLVNFGPRLLDVVSPFFTHCFGQGIQDSLSHERKEMLSR